MLAWLPLSKTLGKELSNNAAPYQPGYAEGRGSNPCTAAPSGCMAALSLATPDFLQLRLLFQAYLSWLHPQGYPRYSRLLLPRRTSP